MEPMRLVTGLPPELRLEIWKLVYQDQEFEMVHSNYGRLGKHRKIYGTYTTACLQTCFDHQQRASLAKLHPGVWVYHPDPRYTVFEEPCSMEGECTIFTCPVAYRSWPLYLPILFAPLHDEIERALFMYSRFRFSNIRALETFLRHISIYQGPFIRHVEIVVDAQLSEALRCKWYKPDRRLPKMIGLIGPLQSLHLSLRLAVPMVQGVFDEAAHRRYVDAIKTAAAQVPALRTRYLRVDDGTTLLVAKPPRYTVIQGKTSLLAERWYDQDFCEISQVTHEPSGDPGAFSARLLIAFSPM